MSFLTLRFLYPVGQPLPTVTALELDKIIGADLLEMIEFGLVRLRCGPFGPIPPRLVILIAVAGFRVEEHGISLAGAANYADTVA